MTLLAVSTQSRHSAVAVRTHRTENAFARGLSPSPGPALLRPGVTEVHQFPDRFILVSLDQLSVPVMGDLDVAGKAQVGTVEAADVAAIRLRPLRDALARNYRSRTPR